MQARLRDIKGPDKGALQAGLERVEKQLEDVVGTLTEVGRSDALTAKLRALEDEKARIRGQLEAEPSPPRIVPNVEKAIRERIKELANLPRDPTADPALMEKARASIKAKLGTMRVVEGVFAEVDLGRWYISHGAEERKPIRGPSS